MNASESAWIIAAIMEKVGLDRITIDLDRVAMTGGNNASINVYRTLDLLEELGLARHHHGPDGRETYHLEETTEHGHLHCRGCGAEQELDAAAAAPILKSITGATGFSADLDHLSLQGLCATCRADQKG